MATLCHDEVIQLRLETDNSHETFQEIVDALKTNSPTKKVRIFLPRDFLRTHARGAEGESALLRWELLRSVGLLPKLEQLKIEAYSGLAEFPVRALSDVVKGARQLKEIELWDLQLGLYNVNADGSSEDLEMLESSLHNHPSLEKFTLYNCQLREDVSCTLDPLLRALASIPTLKQVYVTAAAAASSTLSHVSFTCAALEDLCRSKSLQKLGLWKFNLPHSQRQGQPEDPLALMAPAIAKTNNMKMFEFGKCRLSQTGDEALAAMLERNTSLEEIDLHLDSTTGESTLDEGDCAIVATAAALEKHNTTLKRLKLWGLMTRRSQEALVMMMRHNYSLETCRLLDADRDISEKIGFFIGLNRAGRKGFLSRDKSVATAHQWVELIAGGDLSTIFYYLSMEPGLCEMQR